MKKKPVLSTCFHFFVCMQPEVGSYGSFMFNFSRNLHAVFYSGQICFEKVIPAVIWHKGGKVLGYLQGNCLEGNGRILDKK